MRRKEIKSIIEDAIKSKNSIVITYNGRYGKTRSIVDPYKIGKWRGNIRLYLLAYCHLRDEKRIFYLSSIKAAEVLNNSFKISPKIDLKDSTPRTFSLRSGISAVADRKEGLKLLALMNQTIDIFKYSTRVGNCLHRTKIKTIGDLIMKRERDLLKVKHLGKGSLEEIVNKLNELHLYLGMEIPTLEQIETTEKSLSEEEIKHNEQIRELLSKSLKIKGDVSSF